MKTETATGHLAAWLAGYGFSLNWSFRLGVDANDDVAISSNTNARASLPPTLNKNFIHKYSQKQTNEAKKAMDTSHACAARTATKWRGKTYYTPHYTHTAHTRTLMQICSKFYGQACNASKPDVLNSNYGNRICASSHLFIIMLHLHLFNKAERGRERERGAKGCLAA